MGKKQKSNQDYSVLVWGLLFILWGVTILFDFIPFGVGLLGTSLILLGVNVIRVHNGLPTKGNNTIFGTLTLVWGVLELARPILHTLFKFTDLDWVIFAILLVVLGVIIPVPDSPRTRKTSADELH